MDGIVKEVTQEPARSPVIKNVEVREMVVYDSVPVDFYRYFGEDFQTDTVTKERMADIYEWLRAGKPDGTVGDLLLELRHLDSRMGSPRAGETRVRRAHGWLKMTAQIRELEKRREALRGGF